MNQVFKKMINHIELIQKLLQQPSAELLRCVPNWNIDEIKNLNYKFAPFKDEMLVSQYAQSGHDRSKISVYNYHEPNEMPKFITEHVKPRFDFLDKVCAAFNYFKPGQYLPPHSDLYGKYMQLYDVHPKNIVRCILMLENSCPGQILQIKDSTFGSWKSGDCFYWNYDEIHAFYNFSMKDRYAIQITGVINEKSK